ncbi:MAG: RsmE family RNA methyltransferase [Proteobacteria bacterium]|nr:RsmE family RNA methyltransferase [Pseudomonadota bacterium]
MPGPLRRFYLAEALGPGRALKLPEELSHRLHRVLRLGEGATIALFNGEDGLFEATLTETKCRSAQLGKQLRAQTALPALHLALALPKKDAWETSLRQATELGVTTITPLKTAFTQVAHLNAERAHAQLVEAAEQSERLILPTLNALQPLDIFLEKLSTPCAWAYERHDAQPSRPPASTVLIGPEGGFSAEEVALLSSHPHIVPFSLGPTILRVDTAVAAALALLRL